MSESTVNVEQLNEVSNKDKDEKKVKKKKSVKSSDGKSKSSSRKSSAVTTAENCESTTVENEDREDIVRENLPQINGSSDQNQSALDIPSNGASEQKSNTETEGLVPEIESEKSDEKGVIMLREMDFRMLAELKEAFHLFDINRDGYIDKEDLRFTFTSMGKPDVSEEAIEQMLSEMSSDGVDFDSFVKLFGYKAIELDPEEELLAALSKWDYQGNGMISEEILKRDLQGSGDKFSEKEAERALEEAPLYKKDGMTMIDYVKFCHNICGLRNIEKTRQIEKEADAYEKELRSFLK